MAWPLAIQAEIFCLVSKGKYSEDYQDKKISRDIYEIDNEQFKERAISRPSQAFLQHGHNLTKQSWNPKKTYYVDLSLANRRQGVPGVEV